MEVQIQDPYDPWLRPEPLRYPTKWPLLPRHDESKGPVLATLEVHLWKVKAQPRRSAMISAELHWVGGLLREPNESSRKCQTPYPLQTPIWYMDHEPFMTAEPGLKLLASCLIDLFLKDHMIHNSVHIPYL